MPTKSPKPTPPIAPSFTSRWMWERREPDGTMPFEMAFLLTAAKQPPYVG